MSVQGDNAPKDLDSSEEAEARRDFLKKAAKGAVTGAATAPAVAMLLSASARSAKAQNGCGCS